MSNENVLISFDNFDFTSGKPRLNSPRSLEAIDKLGYDNDELLFLDFKTFKLKNTDINNLSKITQKARYDYYEKHRLEKINEVLKVIF